VATLEHSTAPVARPGFDARWRRVYQLHAMQIPAMRAVSFILLTLLLGFYNSRVNPQIPFAITLRYAVIAVTYITVSWFILHLHYLRPRERHRAWLALFFTLLDPFVIAGAVYWSGADRSWLFVLILIPIVSQSYFSGTRAIAVGISSACAYLAMLVYAGGPISWPVATGKVAVIAGAAIYCIWVGYIEERYRSSMIQAIRNAKEETERLYTIAGAMAESLELETVLNEILRQLAQFIDFDTGTVQIVEGDAMRVLAGRNVPPAEIGRVRASGRFQTIPSIDARPDATTLRVPLVVRDRIIGALILESHRPKAYGEREANAVMAVAQHAAVALDHARLYRAERELAVSDPLTGIANRRRFEELLHVSWEKALHEQTSLAALMIDVDAFKAYNDRYGHQKGDDVLRAVAAQLRVHANGHLVARYCGEEFVVVATGCGRAEAAELAEAFRVGVESLQIPHEGSPARVVTLSIGAAAMVPADESADPLIARADALLYQAKRGGRNRVVT
jgi:diguanylate cyclase (GGDEF)-like protein